MELFLFTKQKYIQKMQMTWKTDELANSVDPDQTAPQGAV